jgi:hypothetical protein
MKLLFDLALFFVIEFDCNVANTWGGSMLRTTLLTLLAATAFTATATAASPKLKGSYGFTGTAACLVAPGHVGDANVPPPLPNPTPFVALPNSGFNAQLRPNDSLPAPASPSQNYSRSFAVEGIRTFDGNGNGTVKGTAVGITVRPTPGPNGFPHFPPAAGAADFTFKFTYTVDGNGGWTATMVPGSYSETFLTGPRTGQTATVDAIPPVTGMISEDGKTLIAAHTTTAVRDPHVFEWRRRPADLSSLPRLHQAEGQQRRLTIRGDRIATGSERTV